MAIIGTFNGANIVALPTSPGFKQLELIMNDTAAINRSPFTGQTQIQAWSGADWWEASLALPQMTQEDAGTWSAFFGELRGIVNVFYLNDPLRAQPFGNPQGAPVVNGVNVPMSTTLDTKGWTPNTFRNLIPGDQLQIGYRLHRVLNVVNADSSGNAVINIWPSIREATIDGQAIILNNPVGLFRLTENRRSVLSDETRLSGISFKAVEAR